MKYKKYKEAVYYKEMTELSYDDLSKIVGMDRTGICLNVNSPARTGIKTFLKIAKAIKMPEEKAVELWRRAKMEHETAKLERSIQE